MHDSILLSQKECAAPGRLNNTDREFSVHPVFQFLDWNERHINGALIDAVALMVHFYAFHGGAEEDSVLEWNLDP